PLFRGAQLDGSWHMHAANLREVLPLPRAPDRRGYPFLEMPGSVRPPPEMSSSGDARLTGGSLRCSWWLDRRHPARSEQPGETQMATWTPDPTFYPSATMAMSAPREQIAYVAVLNPYQDGRPDALAVLDVDPSSPRYGQETGRLNFPYAGDELHHFGWNACSA